MENLQGLIDAKLMLKSTNIAVDNQLIVLTAIQQLNTKFFDRVKAGETTKEERLEHLMKIQTLKDIFAGL